MIIYLLIALIIFTCTPDENIEGAEKLVISLLWGVFLAIAVLIVIQELVSETYFTIRLRFDHIKTRLKRKIK